MGFRGPSLEPGSLGGLASRRQWPLGISRVYTGDSGWGHCRRSQDCSARALEGKVQVKWDVVGWDPRQWAALEVGSRPAQSASGGSSAPLITNRTSRSPKFPMAENSGFARTTSATFFYSLCNPVHLSPPRGKANHLRRLPLLRWHLRHPRLPPFAVLSTGKRAPAVAQPIVCECVHLLPTTPPPLPDRYMYCTVQ